MKDRKTFKAEAEMALILATADAASTGTGFVRFLKDGTVERLPPSCVLYMPDDPDIPE